MFFKINYFAIIMLGAIGVVSCNAFPNIIAQTNDTSNTFVDPKSGISFHYPSDWHIASQKYTRLLFENTAIINSLSGNNSSDAISPVVIVLPESLNGASFVILTEALPFPISIDKYFENTKNQLRLASVPMGNAIHISINNLSGVKYNITLPNGIMQTQMLFIKDSNGIVIGYIPGTIDHVKNLGDINSIIKSLTFKPNSQGTGSSGGGNVKNITSDSKQSTLPNRTPYNYYPHHLL
jgi:hypothetical protein